MSFDVTANMTLAVSMLAEKDLGLGRPANRLSLAPSYALTPGSADGRANLMWHKQITLVGVTPETLDLQALGDGPFAIDLSGSGPEQVVFSTVKMIGFQYVSGVDNVTVSKTSTSAPWGDSSLDLIAGSQSYVAMAADGVGYALTAANKGIQLVKDAGGTNAVVNIWVIGVE